MWSLLLSAPEQKVLDLRHARQPLFDPSARCENVRGSRTSCDVVGLFGVLSYRVGSFAPAPIARSFIQALNGTDIKITNDIQCAEFGFWFSLAKISAFCASPEHEIWLLKSNVSEQADKNAELQAAINRLIGRLEDFGTPISGLDAKVTELTSNVTKMSSKST
jgi:hypothetical protein